MEASTTYRHLQFINYKDIANWSVQYVDDANMGFTRKYPLARIGSFLNRRKVRVNIENNILYKRVSVSTIGSGITIRDEKYGRDIGTKSQYYIKQSQFLLSKIDARNGAFGVVPKEADGAIITSNFWTYDVDTDIIHPEFLVLITRTERFLKFIEKCSNGTTNRHYLQEQLFLQQQIPLPTIDEQRSILSKYTQLIEQANLLNKKVAEIRQTIFDYWDKQLYEPEQIVSQSSGHLLSFASFRDISQWGLDFIGTNKKDKTHISLFHIHKISDLCIIGSGGTPNRNVSSYFNGSIPWIKTGELMDEIINDTEEKITKEALEKSSARMYQKGSIIIAMYGATIGKTAKLGIDASTNQACAVLHHINENVVLADFVWFFLQTQVKKLKSQAYGGAQPNINASIIANTIIPIPDIKTQERMVAHTISLKQDIHKILDQSLSKRQEAKTLLSTFLYQ